MRGHALHARSPPWESRSPFEDPLHIAWWSTDPQGKLRAAVAGRGL